MFFFEKKNQKPFSVGCRAKWAKVTHVGDGAGPDFFCFFFQKKKTFLTLPPLLAVLCPQSMCCHAAVCNGRRQ
jgi:hypothetical protein